MAKGERMVTNYCPLCEASGRAKEAAEKRVAELVGVIKEIRWGSAYGPEQTDGTCAVIRICRSCGCVDCQPDCRLAAAIKEPA